MLSIRLTQIITRMEINPHYKNLFPRKNDKPYPSLTDFFNQPGIIDRIKKDLTQQWDSAESLFFFNLTENEKYTRYTFFVYCVYLKFQKEPGLDLKGCWDSYYAKMCSLRHIEFFGEPSWDLQDLFE